MYFINTDGPPISIHEAGCRYCNNGQGLHRLPKRDYWQGPFERLEDAEAGAKAHQADWWIKYPACCFPSRRQG
jgi:hypothetical protein